MTIKLFTQDGIDLVAKMAAGVWGKEQGAHSSEVSSLFCQHLCRLRHNQKSPRFRALVLLGINCGGEGILMADSHILL